MDKERIAEAIRTFRMLIPGEQRPVRTDDFEFDKALAEHLAAELPVTVDELVAAIDKYNEEHRGTLHYVKCYSDYSGGLYVGGNDRKVMDFPYGKKSGAVILAAIQAKLKPEPTEAEQALSRIIAVAGQAVELTAAVAGDEFRADAEIVRKGLEGK